MTPLRIPLTLVIFSLCACVITEQVYEKNGKPYGVVEGAFRARWYNYYERGLSFLEGGYHPEAIADFRAARALRGRDQRRARTYGLHFIDYFPNRERGIALLASGDVDGAADALRASLTQVDSGRAEYYYNVARREQLVAAGVKDRSPPQIRIERPLAGLQRKPRLELVARIADPSLVAEARIAGKPALVPVARDELTLTQAVELEPGLNRIVVSAVDLFGNRAEKTVELVLDEQPPVISIQTIRERAGEKFAMGAVSDASGVASFLASGAAPEGAGAGGKTLDFVIPIRGDVVALKAEDRAGNVAEVSFEPAALERSLAAADADPPSIQVNAPPPVVYTERIFLDGWVADKKEVAALSVGGQPVGTPGRRTVYFRHVIPLQEGVNEIRVVATDDAGREAQKVIEVTRKEPAIRALDARLSITMAPFVATGDKDEGREAVEQNLENAVVEQRRFHLLDRSRVAALVTEWQLVATNLAEDRFDLLRLGAAMSADTTMMGWVKENDRSIEVYARLVDTETGKIVIEKDVFHEKKSLRNVRELLFGLGLKLEAALPVLDGRITRIEAEAVEIAMSDAALLPRGARVVLYHATTPESPYGSEQRVVGEARIETVAETSVVARLIHGELSPGAAAITK